MLANDNIRLHITADVDDKTGNAIKNIKGNLKEIPAEVTTKIKADGKQAKKEVDDVNKKLEQLNGKNKEIKVTAAGTQALNTINSIKKSLSELPKNVSTKIDINAKEAKSQLDSLKKTLNSISKDISTTVKLNHKQADTSIESYKKKLKDITAPIETNTKVRLDTRSALASLNNLNAKLKELKDSDLKLKFSVEGAATIKALSNGIQSFNKSADAANKKLDKLKNISEILGKIEKNVGINVSINGADETSNKLKEIYGLLKGIRKYSNVKINANANVSGGSPRVQAQPQGSNRSGSNLGSYESQLRGIVAKAEQAHMRGDAQELAKLRQEYVLTTQEMLNFQRQFGNGDYNNAIKKLTPIVQTLQRLGIIARDDLGPIRELSNMQFNWDAQIKASTPRTYKQMAQTEKELAEYARQNGNLAESDNHLRNAARLEAEARSINTALEVQRTLQGNIEQTLKEQIKSLEKIAAEQRMQGDTRNLAYTEARLRQLKQEEQLAKARQNPDAYKGLMQEANVYKEQLANPTLTPEARRQLYTQIINTVSNATRQGLRDGMIDNRQAASNYQKLMPYARELGVENNLQNEITRLGGATNNVGGQQANNARNEYNDLKRQAVQAIEDINRAWRAGSGTEEEERRLDNILNRMRQIKREAGTLNQSTEANLYTTLANGTQRGSRGYDVLTERAKQARANRQELRADTGAGTDRNTPFGSKENIFAYVIRFIGRSSKGVGSAMEAMSQLMKDVQPLQGARGLTGILARAVPMTAAVSAAVLAFEKAIELAVQGVQTFSNILIQLGTAIYNALKPGIELYKNQTSSTFSFGASLLSNGYDENGNQLGKSLQNKNDIFGTSRELVNRASIDAEMSAFSLDDILKSLQGTLPVLMQKGMSLDQAYDVNKGVAGVSKMLQLAPSQILQETRDLAQGSITARGSQVAGALGVTNEDLAGKSADEIWELLMEKFQNYSEMLTQFEDTAMGRAQQLDERLSMVGKTFVEQLAGGFKSIAEYIIKFTGQYVDNDANGNQTAHLDSISGHWYSDKEGEEGTDLGTDYNPQNAEFNLSEPFQEAADILKQIIIYIADAIDEVIDFVDNTSNLSDPLSTGESIIELIIDGLVTCVEFLIGCLDAAISFANGLEWIVPILSVIGKLCKSIWAILKAAINLIVVLAKGVLAAIDEVLSAIPESIRTKLGLKVNVDGDIESIKASLGDTYSDLVESVAPWTDTPVSHTWKQMFGLNNAPNGRIGTLGTLIREGFARGDGVPKSGSGPRMSQVNGNPSPTDKDADKRAKAAQRAAEKANREAIKESQRMLKERQQALKEILDDTLNKLKEELRKANIAYKQGFLTIEEYFTKKAEIERAEAEARLKEAQEERVAIENSRFNSEYEKLSALHKVDREIRKYSLEVGKSVTAQKELNNLLGQYSDIISNSNLTGTLNRINSGTQTDNRINSGTQTDNRLLGVWKPKNDRSDETDSKLWDLAFKETEEAYKRGYVVNPGVFRGIHQMEAQENGVLTWLSRDYSNYWGLKYDANNASKYNMYDTGMVGDDGGTYAGFNNIEDGIRAFFDNYIDHKGTSYLGEIANASNDGYAVAQIMYNNSYFTGNPYTYGQVMSEYTDDYNSWGLPAVVDVFSNSLQANTQAVQSNTQATSSFAGYLADGENSLYDSGIDARYVEWSGFENSTGTSPHDDLNQLAPYVKMLINAVAKEYFEATGEKLRYNVAVGGVHTPGPYGHNQGKPDGQNVGYKIDLDIGQNEELIGRLVQKYGGAASRENENHLDISFGPGRVGVLANGYMLTTNTTGQSAFDTYSSGNIQNNTTLNKVPQPQADTSDLAVAARDAINKFIEEYNNVVEDIRSNIFGEMPDFKVKFAETYKKLENLEKVSSRDELSAEMVEKLKIQIRQKIAKLETDFYENMLEVNLERIQQTGKDIANRIATGQTDQKQIEEYYKKYWGYFHGDGQDVEVMKKNLEKMKQKKEKALNTWLTSKDGGKEYSNGELIEKYEKEYLDLNNKQYELEHTEGSAQEEINKVIAQKLERRKKLHEMYAMRDYIFKPMEDNISEYQQEIMLAMQTPINQMIQLEKKYIEQQDLGNVGAAQEIRKRLESARETLYGVFETWIKAIEDKFDTMDNYFAEMPVTNLQREQGQRELKAYRNRELVKANQDKLNALTEEYRERTFRITKNEQETAHWKDVQAQAERDGVRGNDTYVEAGKHIKELAHDTQAAKLEMSELNRQIGDTDNLIRLEKELSKLPDLFRDAGKVAKQALEDGLVTFLTDGVNEAESLEDALLNLAQTFLKTMQEFFAKQMVTTLMNALFGHYDTEGNGERNDLFKRATVSQDLDINDENAKEHRIVYFSGADNEIVGGDIHYTDEDAKATVKALKDEGIIARLDENGKGYSVPVSSDEASKWYTDYVKNTTVERGNQTLEGIKSEVSQKDNQEVVNAVQDSGNKITSTLTETNAKLDVIHSDLVQGNVEEQENNTEEQENNEEEQANQADENFEQQQQTQAVQSMEAPIEDIDVSTERTADNTEGSASSGGVGTESGAADGSVAPMGNYLKLSNEGFSEALEPINGFLNNSVFGDIFNGLEGMLGSAGAQLGGMVFGIKTLFDGDKKEKLLSMIFLELQLIYTTLQSATSVVGHATGGFIRGAGTSTSDSIPAMLSNGEYVISADSVRKYGTNFMNAVNDGTFTQIPLGVPKFADGGFVGDTVSEETARGMSSFAGQIANNVSTTTNMSVALVGNQDEAMEHFMKSPRAQRIMLDFSRKTARFSSTLSGRF